MATALLYSDAVAVTVTYLRAALADAGQAVPVVSQIPNPRPAKFVRVSRTGGAEVLRRIVDGAQITVDTWAATEADVTDIGNLCRRLLAEMEATVQSGTAVHRVDEVGFVPSFTDPASNTPMSTLTVQIQLRGQAA